MEAKNFSSVNKSASEVQSSNEMRVINNQLAFGRFCELCKRGYYIHVELKSKKRDKASFWITACQANEKTEEIRLFVNQEIVNMVINYLTYRQLGDISKINPNDLDSFNEKVSDFKRELFQIEKAKGKKATWSYTAIEKNILFNYNQGVIIFKPYPYPSRQK